MSPPEAAAGPPPQEIAAPVVATASLQRSLRRFITFDQATCLVAVGVILAVHSTLHASGYLLVLAGMVVAAAGAMGLGRRPLARGDLGRAVLCVAGANWGISLVATAIAPFCLPITVVAAMVPSVLAIPYVGSRALARINVASMVVCLAVVLLATTQDFSGFTAGLPAWLPEAMLIAFVPFTCGLVVVVSAHNSARLTRAVVDVLQANARLRVSELSLRASRARLVAATDGERRRIAQDLHDGAQQRFLTLGLGVQQARRLVATDPHGASALLSGLADDLRACGAELRSLAHGIYPAVLTDRGLAEALAEMAARAPCRCHLDVDALVQCSRDVEASVYWCCVEALQNVAKHAGSHARARIKVATADNGALALTIEDDGPGFDPASVPRGQGLVNMADRIGAVGGQLSVWSQPGSGVRVQAVVPGTPPPA